MTLMVGKKDPDFIGYLFNFIKNKEKEINKKIFITFGNTDVHLYTKDKRSRTFGFVTYDGNFYDSRENLKNNVSNLNIINTNKKN